MLGTISKRNVRRFSLLFLEEKEYYFEDLGATLVLPSDTTVNEGSLLQGGGGPLILSNMTHRIKLKGRLHICSKSLYFDPDESRQPVYRFSFANMRHMVPRACSTSATDFGCLVLAMDTVVQIFPNQPYTFVTLDPNSSKGEFIIAPSFANITVYLPTISRLHEIHSAQARDSHSSPRGRNSLPTSSSSSSSPSPSPSWTLRPEAMLSALVKERESNIRFDVTRLEDLRERPQLPQGEAILAQEVSPLVTVPGRLLLTDARLYFQPFNNVTTDPVHRYPLSQATALHKRRYAMMDIGMELFFPADPLEAKSVTRRAPSLLIGSSTSSLVTSPSSSSSSGSSSSSSSPTSSSQAPHIEVPQASVFFIFSSPAERDTVYDAILRQSAFQPRKALSPGFMMMEWCQGRVSNYDYLLFLNQQSGRSFQDLAQYPVFPWVIKDYVSKQLDLKDERIYRDLSKPIGALNPSRLEHFRMRMREMPLESCYGKPFLYGTHYSTPGYVLHYLVRRAPEYLLKLQNGKFDQADRLFLSIAASWRSCQNSNTDVKELIPEFYDTSAANVGGFLLNDIGLDLGITQRGESVDDVALPPWASNHKDLVMKLRSALESDYVSVHLNEWIDLIFGFKQTGPAAVAADNVFYPLTYPDAVDLSKLSEEERGRIELQINEFGQMPKQVFTMPHPRKGDIERATEVAAKIDPLFAEELKASGASSSAGGGSNVETNEEGYEIGNGRASQQAEERERNDDLSGINSSSGNNGGGANGSVDSLEENKSDLALTFGVNVEKAPIPLTHTSPTSANAVVSPTTDSSAAPTAEMPSLFVPSTGPIGTSGSSSNGSVPIEVNSSHQGIPPTQGVDDRLDGLRTRRPTSTTISSSPAAEDSAAARATAAAVAAAKGALADLLAEEEEEEDTGDDSAQTPTALERVPTGNGNLKPRASGKAVSPQNQGTEPSRGSSTGSPQPLTKARDGQTEAGSHPPQSHMDGDADDDDEEEEEGEGEDEAALRAARDKAIADMEMKAPSGACDTGGWAFGWGVNTVVQPTSVHKGTVTRVEASQDGKLAYVLTADGIVKVVSLPEVGQRRSSKVSNLALSALAIVDPAGQYGAVASLDNHLYLYCMGYGNVTSTIENAHDSAVSALSLANGVLVSGGWDGVVKVWDLSTTGIQRAPIADLSEHSTGVCAVDLVGAYEATYGNIDRSQSPRNKSRLVVSGAEDGEIIVWDLDHEASVSTIQAHSAPVTSLRVVADVLISASADGAIKWWSFNPSTGQISSQPKAVAQFDEAVDAMVVGPGGKAVIIGGKSGILTCVASSSPSTPVWKKDVGAPITALALSKACPYASSSSSSSSSSSNSPSTGNTLGMLIITFGDHDGPQFTALAPQR